MPRHGTCIGILALILVLTAGLVSVVQAQEKVRTTQGVPYPDIAPGVGDSCVEEIGLMRRNHMDMLKHERDETMLEGIRGGNYSLKECLDCHAVKGPDAVPVTISSPQHFCRSCHDYAAVSIDCFQCHASRPDSTVMGEAHGG